MEIPATVIPVMVIPVMVIREMVMAIPVMAMAMATPRPVHPMAAPARSQLPSTS